ncbi:MAG: winged helix-turn-helix transcriptional regulator [Gammaproteobacteria bacterium]
MLNIRNIDSRLMNIAEIEPASIAFELLLQGKWRLQILLVMCSGPVRLGRLARVIPGASKKVLTQNLRKLEADGIVVRTDFSNVVLHVENDLHPDLRDSVSRRQLKVGSGG